MSILAIIGITTAAFVVSKFVTDVLLRGGKFMAATLLNAVVGAAAVVFIVMNAPSFWAGVGCYFAAAAISLVIGTVVSFLMPKSNNVYNFA